MEDTRITKTKRNIKKTLIEMMNATPFEKITVTQLCNQANTSRITFYTYYSDKYDLLEAVFVDLSQELHSLYEEKQKDNPDSDPALGFHNMLDSFLDLYFKYNCFVSHLNLQKDPTMQLSYFRYMVENTMKIFAEYKDLCPVQYDVRSFSIFLVTGFWGYIRLGHPMKASGEDRRRVYEDAHSLLADLLASPAFALPSR